MQASVTLAIATFLKGVLDFIGIIPDSLLSKVATFVAIILSGIMAQYWRTKRANESLQATLDLQLKAIEIEQARMNLEAAREHHRREGDKHGQ